VIHIVLDQGISDSYVSVSSLVIHIAILSVVFVSRFYTIT